MTGKLEGTEAPERRGASAVILFGIVHRSLRHTVASIRERILRPLRSQGDVDLYFHSWHADLIDNPRTGENQLVLDRDEISRLLPEARGLIEDQGEFDESLDWEPYWPDNPMRHCTDNEAAARATLMNFRRAIESQQRAWNFFNGTKSRSYDRVVVARADLLFLDELILPARPMQKDELWVPQFQAWGGINDRFAAGSEEAIRKYCSRIDAADHWLLKEKGGNSEQFLSRCLKLSGLRVNGMSFHFQRVRANGAITSMDTGVTSRVLMDTGSPGPAQPLPAAPDKVTEEMPLERAAESAFDATERVLILSRDGGESARQLHALLRHLCIVEIVVDRPPEHGEHGSEVVFIPDEELTGFEGMTSNLVSDRPYTAWGRGMCRAIRTVQPGDHVWFIEEDVALQPDAFVGLLERTREFAPALATREVHAKHNDSHWHWWGSARYSHRIPTRSFNPICRLSAELVQAIESYRKEQGMIGFHEIALASIAADQGLPMLDWRRDAESESSFGVFRFRPHVETRQWGISHPVKDARLHYDIGGVSKAPAKWWDVLCDVVAWRYRCEFPLRVLSVGQQENVFGLLRNVIPHPESEVHAAYHPLATPVPGMEEEPKPGAEDLARVFLNEGESPEILAWMISSEGYWESFDVVHLWNPDPGGLVADASMIWALLKPRGLLFVKRDLAGLDLFVTANASRAKVVFETAFVVVQKCA